MAEHVRRVLPALFWAAILVSFLIAISPRPIQVPGNPSDKIQHILAFLVLATLGRLAYPKTGALKLLIGLSLFGALIEVVQSIPALHRDAELLDWIADTAAAGFVLGLAALLGRRRA